MSSRCFGNLIDCTKANVHMHGQVFVALNNLSQPFLVNLMSNILNHAIQLAGLEDTGYSAKNFRPTVATAVVQANLDPDQV